MDKTPSCTFPSLEHLHCRQACEDYYLQGYFFSFPFSSSLFLSSAASGITCRAGGEMALESRRVMACKTAYFSSFQTSEGQRENCYKTIGLYSKREDLELNIQLDLIFHVCTSSFSLCHLPPDLKSSISFEYYKFQCSKGRDYSLEHNLFASLSPPLSSFKLPFNLSRKERKKNQLILLSDIHIIKKGVRGKCFIVLLVNL